MNEHRLTLKKDTNFEDRFRVEKTKLKRFINKRKTTETKWSKTENLSKQNKSIQTAIKTNLILR